MKRKIKILLIALSIGGFMSLSACDGDGENDCPTKLFDTLQECEDATDGVKCVCVPEGTKWEAVKNV